MNLKDIEQTIKSKRDELLIKATLNGDSRSFGILVSFYKKRIFSLGLSFFKNETDSEDFVQEVLIKIFKNLSKFKGESSFSTWMTKIAYNTAINSINRKQKYEPISNEELLESKDLTPEEKQIKKVTIEAVKESIKELPEKYAICVELYFFYDNSYEEIAKITGLTLNTIKSHIFRAKKILRGKLEEFYEK